ncbi:transglycosylase domain-containing protein [Desulfotomaculum copahuensis]|uniref:Penicillin-binding protein 1A n=1 Tax=Desulfotomaculum copahuensis TaxID=1838280 RepID=A0A1B7LAN9_9FIRM|nr:PBP1A family penicillin-binding protein [Desulfotomaculum copahuensis]OAT79380.1 penicillin-binding protein [Desulfotomaculum copahuensis]
MGARRKKKKLRPSRLIILLLALFVLLGGSSALAMVAVSVKDMPAISGDKLLSSAATVLYDQDGKLITRVGTENRVPVKLKDIPEPVRQAFLAIEDVRFYQHQGVDLRGVARAAWANITGRSIREGASTISQQLVKLSLLGPDQTWKRKIQQMILAVMLEQRYTKQEILEMYLNKIYFGEGAYGIQAAAETYFNKPAGQLDYVQGAVLAGLVQAPSAYDPFNNPGAATARRNLVLDNMARYGMLTPEQANRGKARPIKNDLQENKGSPYPDPYFVDYVTSQLVDRYGADKVFKGGLRVYTTLDPRIQQATEEALSDPRNFPASVRDDKKVLQPEGAAAFLDPHTGYIKAIAGGREHTHRLQWNRATMPPGRQPGSSFKPIIAYGPAVDLKGMGPASVIDDIPVRYGSYAPRNYDGRYRGLITMRTALTNSINIVAVKLLMNDVSLPAAINFARGLGIDLDPRHCGAGIALGGLYSGVTPLQMAAAYGAFDNYGLYLTPTAIIRVKDFDGKDLYTYKPLPRQAMKATTAYLITGMLKSVVQRGTGTNANPGRPAAGKTGTTDDGKDLWFVGYTPELAGAVWIGYDEPEPMPLEFGGRYPALIWRQIITRALHDTPVRDFPRPPGIVTATVDGKSGLLPGPNTPPADMVTDLFARGTVPTRVDNTHVLMDVCAKSGQLPGPDCPVKVSRVFIQLPYTVPGFVEDFKQRAPTAVCPEHPAPGDRSQPPGDKRKPGAPGQPGNTPPGGKPPGKDSANDPGKKKITRQVEKPPAGVLTDKASH